MSEHQIINIPVNKIIVPANRRPINSDVVGLLADSMTSQGLRTPITIRYVNGEPHLVAGAHRLEGAKKNAWESIPAVVMHGDDIDARLWEIAENLMRSDLSLMESSDQTAEWVRLTNVRAEKAKAQVEPSGKAHTGGRPNQGINAAVEKLGIERNQAQRAVKIASLSPEAKQAARDVGLDNNQRALLTAAKEAPERQAAVIKEIAGARTTKPTPPAVAPKEPDVKIAARYVADWIAEHASVEDWNRLQEHIANFSRMLSAELGPARARAHFRAGEALKAAPMPEPAALVEPAPISTPIPVKEQTENTSQAPERGARMERVRAITAARIARGAEHAAKVEAERKAVVAMHADVDDFERERQEIDHEAMFAEPDLSGCPEPTPAPEEYDGPDTDEDDDELGVAPPMVARQVGRSRFIGDADFERLTARVCG